MVSKTFTCDRCQCDDFEDSELNDNDTDVDFTSDMPLFNPRLGGFAGYHADPDLQERPRTAVRDEEGAFYTGQWRDGYRYGKGKMERLGVGVYEGQFVMNQAEGQGTFIKLNGDSYEGQWLRNRAHGRGTYSHNDGSSYLGEWAEDLKSGIGIESWLDDSRYEGEYLEGRKHGKGLYYAPDQSMYEGGFEDDFMQGEGTYTFADGRVYVGQWVESRMVGEGKMSWPDGRFYQGQYEDDRKEGDGTFEWPDGRAFAGQWSRGRQHGRGTYTDARGRRWTGDWEKGQKLDPRSPSASPEQSKIAPSQQSTPEHRLSTASTPSRIRTPGDGRHKLSREQSVISEADTASSHTGLLAKERSPWLAKGQARRMDGIDERQDSRDSRGRPNGITAPLSSTQAPVYHDDLSLQPRSREPTPAGRRRPQPSPGRESRLANKFVCGVNI